MTIEELILRSGRAAGHLKNEPPSDESMAGKSRYVLARNAKFPYYGECAYCGGNWGWKKGANHATHLNEKGQMQSGIFLFCEQCDKAVTKAQRGEALDAWKADVLLSTPRRYTPGKILNSVNDILTTELIEFPRKQVRGLQRRR